MTMPLSQLENRSEFIQRHIGPSEQQVKTMLDTVGATSLDALTDNIVPKAILLAEPPRVGGGATEQEALAELKAIASLNKRYKSYIGMGYARLFYRPLFYVTYSKTQVGIRLIRLISQKCLKDAWNRY